MQNQSTQDMKGGMSDHAVRRQLERVCRNAEFENSPRAMEFIQFIVEQTLACLLYTSDAADEYQRV